MDCSLCLGNNITALKRDILEWSMVSCPIRIHIIYYIWYLTSINLFSIMFYSYKILRIYTRALLRTHMDWFNLSPCISNQCSWFFFISTVVLFSGTWYFFSSIRPRLPSSYCVIVASKSQQWHSSGWFGLKCQIHLHSISSDPAAKCMFYSCITISFRSARLNSSRND